MAAETFPRWGLAAVDFMETDAEKVKAEIVTGYESASGRTLADGDPVRLFLLTIADAIVSLRNAVNMTGQQNLLAYAKGGYLDALGLIVACDRKKAAPAITRLRFTLSTMLAQSFVIPKGFQVTNGSVTFATDEALEIPAWKTEGEIGATCTAAGEIGNGYLEGQINTIVSPMTYLDKGENITETNSGADIETDEEYAERIRTAPNAFSVAGPAKAYEYHAKSVSASVLDVAVISPEEKPGEVNVYVLAEGGEMPSDDLISAVNEKVNAEDVRPLTDLVTVTKPEAVPYGITVEYWIAKEDTAKAAQIQKTVEKAVANFRIWQQSKIGRALAPHTLAHNVIAAGASRVNLEALMAAMPYKILEANQVGQCAVDAMSISFKGFDSDGAAAFAMEV